MEKSLSNPKRRRLDSGSWALLLEVYEESGLTVKDFCFSQGIGVASFYLWRKRLGSGKSADIGPFFSPIDIQPKPTGSTEVALPGGVVLRFSGLPPIDYLHRLSALFSSGPI